MSNVSISLICATQYRHVELKRFLESLSRQTCTQFELVIVDQNDSDLILDLIEQYKTFFPILHLKHNFASNSRARNEGVNLASGAYVGFPDDDCWYPENTIEEVLSQLKKGFSGVFINWEDPTGETSKKMFSFENGIMKLEETFVLASCICIFFDKAIFKKHLGFNEKMGLGENTVVKAGEEQDLLLRIISGGGKILKQPEILVYHNIHDRVLDKIFKKRIISQGACDFYFTKKYKGLIASLKLMGFWIAGIFYNFLRLRFKNSMWYFLKIKGAIIIGNRL